MAMRVIVLLLCVFSVSGVDSSALVPARCPQTGPVFLDSVRARCPAWIDLTPPFEVNVESLERELGQINSKTHYSILFYASWCPFSRNFKPIFDTLSFMFPQITHLSIEESSAIPSLFSRYGIHSFPSVLLANGTSKVRFSHPKDLNSIVKFYKEHTGFDPIAHFDVQPVNTVHTQDKTKEPYLLFSILFILLKLGFQILPAVTSRLKSLWTLYARNLKHGMSHILERTALERVWNKTKLFNKGRSLNRGASNARVWASSFASVSLGESSVRTAS
ncbi:hypothetical protein LUZ60_010517 [Juncus effusus]|nr:hypothetical protein LUZ60_010517 [Juncus effusus]